MTGPAWLAAALAIAMLVIAAGSVVRLAFWWLHGRAAEPEADALHVLMGVAMAGMLEPWISPVPDSAWLAVFAVAAAWFGWRAIGARSRTHQGGDGRSRAGSWRCPHPAPHAVECAAMIYMLVPASSDHGPATSMPGMAPAPAGTNPALALVLALFMAGYIVWTADRLASQSRARTAGAGERVAGTGERVARTALAPWAAACSKIAMSLAMGYMLLMMV